MCLSRSRAGVLDLGLMQDDAADRYIDLQPLQGFCHRQIEVAHKRQCQQQVVGDGTWGQFRLDPVQHGRAVGEEPVFVNAHDQPVGLGLDLEPLLVAEMLGAR